jgi:hypothetical protein
MLRGASHLRGCSVVCFLLLCSVVAHSQAGTPRADTKDSDSREPGESHLDPSAYPLAHFLDVNGPGFTGPGVSDKLCLGCRKDNGKVIGIADFSVLTEKRKIGTFSGHTLWELHVTLSLKAEAGKHEAAAVKANDHPPVVWKLILVETSHGLYRKLYGISSGGEYLMPLSWAQVVDLDGHHILASNDPLSGSGAFCSDGYWSLDRPQPEPMDFSQVDIALNDYTPKGSIISESRCWALDLDTQTIKTIARKADAAESDRTSAEVTLHFHVEGIRAIPDHIESVSTVGHD